MGKKKITKEYETLALSEDVGKDKNTNVSTPSVENVKEAKEWVDFNEK